MYVFPPSRILSEVKGYQIDHEDQMKDRKKRRLNTNPERHSMKNRFLYAIEPYHSSHML